MKNVAMFVDSGNLFYHLSRIYPGRKLDYAGYYNHAKHGDNITRAIVYGTQLDREATKFITCLRHMGYDTKYKKARLGFHTSSNVDIVLDIVKIVDRVDIIIIGSSDNDLLPIIDWIKSKGVQVIVMASGIGNLMKEAVDEWIEISEDLLEGFIISPNTMEKEICGTK